MLTDDGSSTIYIPEMDENYHSSHGAIQEARHVFLKNGLETLAQKGISVFEMGFGTGLNALLTAQFSMRHHIKIKYHGIEAFPVEMAMVDTLNYVEKIDPDLATVFSKMHQCDWGSTEVISDCFSLLKIHQKIEDFIPEMGTIDIVYFDAFGPRAQLEMWETSVLSKMHAMLKPNGILVTYCARGQFKRDLKALGFEVESLPGPPGKREMTRAIKK